VSVALVIQHAKRIRSKALSCEASMALPYSPTLTHKRHDFLFKKIIENKMRVMILSTTFSYSKNN